MTWKKNSAATHRKNDIMKINCVITEMRLFCWN